MAEITQLARSCVRRLCSFWVRLTRQQEREVVAVGMVVEVDEEDEWDEGLDGLPVWVIVREAWSTTACLNHKHVERRGQDRCSGGTWDSPGAGLREDVLRGWWCAAGLWGCPRVWVRLW